MTVEILKEKIKKKQKTIKLNINAGTVKAA